MSNPVTDRHPANVLMNRYGYISIRRPGPIAIGTVLTELETQSGETFAYPTVITGYSYWEEFMEQCRDCNSPIPAKRPSDYYYRVVAE